MCGIIGIISQKTVVSRLVEGLKRLEYRGYDSAGVAVVAKGAIERCRAEGKLVNLEEKTLSTQIEGLVGIGHTRWATHGAPNEINAHPHATAQVAVVHNGIIENYQELKAELVKQGAKFASQTDTEVVPHLITHYVKQGLSPLAAVQKSVERLHGAYALGIIFADAPDVLIGARKGSPLAVGYGKGESFLGSDAIALSALTEQVAYLEEGDVAFLTLDKIEIFDVAGKAVKREMKTVQVGSAVDKEHFPHFMLKEIYEQPEVLGTVLKQYCDTATGTIKLPEFSFDLSKITKVTLVACGTSYYAGFVARYWLEQLAKVSVEVEFASEFRYRQAVMVPGELALFISQSGETADTLAALRYAKAQGQHCVSIVNVPESTMARESELVLPIYAGPEIGVASTKAFTAQLMVLACFTIALAEAKKQLNAEEAKKQTYALSHVPAQIVEILEQDALIHKTALGVSKARDAIYIGRGTAYGLAMEGALKLKEISYIHAEALAAGELKHGTIALIDRKVPVIAIAPMDNLFEKTASNIEEVAARGGKILLLSSKKGTKRLKKISWKTIEMPETSALTMPMVYALPIQLVAYHAAVAKGTDVDQPRNLAKSVTVE
jgi:glucosamine--fructose-6-phosphate aminotransferase (isomerizing)